jgi:hypothetical protein
VNDGITIAPPSTAPTLCANCLRFNPFFFIAASSENTMSMGAIIYRAAFVRKRSDSGAALAEQFAMCEKMCENPRSEEMTCHLRKQFLDSRRPSVFLKF